MTFCKFENCNREDYFESFLLSKNHHSTLQMGCFYCVLLQVISLEGWADIMYIVQDSHSFYDFLYFVFLIVVTIMQHCQLRNIDYVAILCKWYEIKLINHHEEFY